MERQLGRIQARHPQVADLYEMEILEEAGHFRLHWQAMRDRRAWQEAREGAYLLRTNLQADSAAELWTKYIQLTEAETAFRDRKSTRLNSSHRCISYAVFCLKKKKIKKTS